MIGIEYSVFTTFVSNRIPSDSETEQLIKWCKIANTHGLVPGTDGNISSRIKPGRKNFFITATETNLSEELSPEDFVKINSANIKEQTNKAEGIKRPSREIFVHSTIYRERPEINAIIHGHSEQILNNFKHLKKISNLPIVCTANAVRPGSLELVYSVKEVLYHKCNFIIMKEHGFLSLGKDLDEAGLLALNMLNYSTMLST